MISIIKKEINSFLCSPVGYVVIFSYLIINGLFMWIFPGELNILDAGISSIDTIFIIAPWVLLFIIPAITMRMFAEEKKNQTLELLLLKPISSFKIVLAKYLSVIILMFIALLPCLIWYLTVYFIGNPRGNIDNGMVIGSFIGLIFLISTYAAIGLLSSIITDNVIIAFISGALLSFGLLYFFDAIASLLGNGSIASFLLYLSINEHYQSMSRGVIDTRDIFYFFLVISLFLFFTKVYLEKLNR